MANPGFFAASQVLHERPTGLLPKCGSCGLFRGCHSPKMKPYGNGARRILVVGEAPGKTEDEQDKPFVGPAGQRLQEEMNRAGVELFEDCWVTNSLICRPPGNKIERDVMVDYCRPNLLNALKEYNPETILLFGRHAVRSLIGELWRENPGGIGRWVGANIPDQKLNAWICPLYHPSYLERMDDPVVDRYFRQQLAAALEHRGRPWNPLPDWASLIEVVDPDTAARTLDEWERDGGQFAVDYEGNCLKPETPGAKLVCCAVCREGGRTIAYPWHGAAIAATGKMLDSERCGFVASNLKHEERWTLWAFGHGVRRWLWDTMIGAHVIDNREGGICELKYQAYILLGMPSWDDHIKRFLRASGDEKLNRVDAVHLPQLMRYCAFDTLLEFKLAKQQCHQLTA